MFNLQVKASWKYKTKLDEGIYFISIRMLSFLLKRNKILTFERCWWLYLLRLFIKNNENGLSYKYFFILSVQETCLLLAWHLKRIRQARFQPIKGVQLFSSLSCDIRFVWTGLSKIGIVDIVRPLFNSVCGSRNEMVASIEMVIAAVAIGFIC